MRRVVPARACELAGRLSALFVADSELAHRLNDAQHRLFGANEQLWSGVHPDALGLLPGEQVPAGQSAIVERKVVPLGAGDGPGHAETVTLRALEQAYWTIHRAFVDYQSVYEERRRLAVDVGELSAQLTEVLCAVGWSEGAARGADVHELAIATAP